MSLMFTYHSAVSGTSPKTTKLSVSDHMIQLAAMPRHSLTGHSQKCNNITLL